MVTLINEGKRTKEIDPQALRTELEHHRFIRECYQLAGQAVARGDHPFGALLALDGVIVATGINGVLTSDDPTRHAELQLLSTAISRFPSEVRSKLVLYSSTEPCVMCSGAIYWSGITTVVFRCSEAALATVAGNDFLVPSRKVFEHGGRPITVVGPLLEEEGLSQHRAFWPTRVKRT